MVQESLISFLLRNCPNFLRSLIEKGLLRYLLKEKDLLSFILDEGLSSFLLSAGSKDLVSFLLEKKYQDLLDFLETYDHKVLREYLETIGRKDFNQFLETDGKQYLLQYTLSICPQNPASVVDPVSSIPSVDIFLAEPKYQPLKLSFKGRGGQDDREMSWNSSMSGLPLSRMLLCSSIKKEVPQNPLGALLHGEPENEVLLLSTSKPSKLVDLKHLGLPMVIPCQDRKKICEDFLSTLDQVSGSDPIVVDEEDLYN